MGHPALSSIGRIFPALCVLVPKSATCVAFGLAFESAITGVVIGAATDATGTRFPILGSGCGLDTVGILACNAFLLAASFFFAQQ
jgi:hypothetical protein